MPHIHGTPLLFVLMLVLFASFDAGAEDEVRREVLLPPKEGNPRNSEGDFVRLRDGRLLFIYTHFTGGRADNARAHLASRVSGDGGLTWSKEDVRVPAKEGAQNTMSVSLERLADGRIGLFYLVKNSLQDCRPYVQWSSDEAVTWTEPALCIADEGYYVVNNDRVVQLKSGRLVIPAAQHRRPVSPPGVAVCYLSDDGGKTWRRNKTELAAPAGSASGLQEPGVVELKDGRLMMFCRTDQGSQFLSWSADGGETWSEARPSEILSPLSPATIERIPSTGDLLMVWNNHSGIDAKLKGLRTPLTVGISKDEGKTWGQVKNIESDPEGWFCYTAVEFVDGRVLLGYCTGKAKLATTQIASFAVEWVYR